VPKPDISTRVDCQARTQDTWSQAIVPVLLLLLLLLRNVI
jgi:hypothetical protein